MKKLFVLLMSVLAFVTEYKLHAQPDRWQQKVKYLMDINMDVESNIVKGKQVLEYWNNSPDTIKVLYYHLYWNAFQPGSMMDTRSLEQGSNIINGRNDWDTKIAGKISTLKPEETGYQNVIKLRLNGRSQKIKVYETILKVFPDQPILPKTKVVLELEFEARVPVQVRRSGRDNAEGVKFSMSQWYPKICEYDNEGWHPNPYISREFYGAWGDFVVNINIDKNYIIGGTGYLQNPEEIGHGYELPGMTLKKPAGNRLTWKFIAPNVHDFAWTADPGYKHVTKTVREGLVLHAFYKIDPQKLKLVYAASSSATKAKMNEKQFLDHYKGEWETILDLAAKAIPQIEKTCGKYPYKQFSFLQGGDGGMEYPMATMLKGAGRGVFVHEFIHSWYAMILANNESLHPWMDEGFTSFMESRILNFLDGDADAFPHKDAFRNYLMLAKSDLDEPLTTHSDHYNTNFAYKINSYYKGEVFLVQLGYITGEKVRDRILQEYFRKWKFRHPDPNDFFRIAEKVSGLQLHWYRDFFVNTNKTIDYGIDSLWEESGKIKIRLKNNGTMPMPLDIELHFKDGSREIGYIPQYLMFGEKVNEEPAIKRTVGDPWKWTHPFYTFEFDRKLLDLKSIEIDPHQKTAEMERKNNKLEINW